MAKNGQSTELEAPVSISSEELREIDNATTQITLWRQMMASQEGSGQSVHYLTDLICDLQRREIKPAEAVDSARRLVRVSLLP